MSARTTWSCLLLLARDSQIKAAIDSLLMSDAKAAMVKGHQPLLIDLALQGGGSHGAFTWGVLDRLLEENWLQIDGISGTSAGAMNAAALASGYALGGTEGARTSLENFWHRVSHAATFSPFQRTPLDRLLGRWTLDCSPAYIATDLMARLVSPYDMDPWLSNPLQNILNESFDFSAIARGGIKLFVTATNVLSRSTVDWDTS
jgi:NTE family protein